MHGGSSKKGNAFTAVSRVSSSYPVWHSDAKISPATTGPVVVLPPRSVLANVLDREAPWRGRPGPPLWWTQHTSHSRPCPHPRPEGELCTWPWFAVSQLPSVCATLTAISYVCTEAVSLRFAFMFSNTWWYNFIYHSSEGLKLLIFFPLTE